LRVPSADEAQHHASVVQKAIQKLPRKARIVEPPPDVDFDAFVSDLVVLQTQKACPEFIDDYHMRHYVLDAPPLMLRLGDLRRARRKGKKFL